MNGRKGIQLSKQYLFVGRNVDLRGGLSIAAVNQARRLSPAGWLSLNFCPVGLTYGCSLTTPNDIITGRYPEQRLGPAGPSHQL
jgi:hypothetical protein